MTTEKFKWQGIVSKSAYPETWRSLWQVANSVIPFLLGWYFMYLSLSVGTFLPSVVIGQYVEAGISCKNKSQTTDEARFAAQAADQAWQADVNPAGLCAKCGNGQYQFSHRTGAG